MMKIIIDKGEKRTLYKINSNTYLFFTGKLMLFPLFSLRKISKEGRLYYASDVIKNTSLYKKIPFQIENIAEIMLKHLNKIVKTLKTDKRIKICVFSEKEDERAFSVCDSVKNFSDVIYFVTENEEFFEEVSKYNMDKYGIATNLKKVENAQADIVLNSSKSHFSGEYVINLSDKEIYGNVLYDIVPQNAGDFKGVSIKKCQFLTENCENFNLIWRNSPKSVDKFEI